MATIKTCYALECHYCPCLPQLKIRAAARVGHCHGISDTNTPFNMGLQKYLFVVLAEDNFVILHYVQIINSHPRL